MSRTLLAAAAALAFIGGIAAGVWLRTEPQPLSLASGTLLEPPRAIAPFALIGTETDVLDNAALEGDWSLMFFGFTRCPDICPNTLQLLSTARKQVTAKGQDAPRIVLVTVDPEYDDPARMRDYTRYFGAGVSGATGSPEAIASLARDLGIVYRRVPLDGDNYTLDHSGSVLLIGPRSDLRAVFSPPFDVAMLAQDLASILEAES